MTLFEGTGISITQEGKRYIGAAIGTESFVKKYVDDKVASWVEEIDFLCQIAQSQPHAAYAAFTDRLMKIGPDYGYQPNAAKTCIMNEYLAQAVTLLEGTGISITQEGKRYLGAAIGTESFVKKYVDDKVASWVAEIDSLCQIAQSQPHVCICSFYTWSHEQVELCTQNHPQHTKQPATT